MRRVPRSWIPFAFLLAGCAASGTPVVDVDVAGETGRSGIFDPSVEYAVVGGTGWLAYSTVSGPELPFGPNVETALARSDDGGATWQKVQTVNPVSGPAQVTLADGRTVDGHWTAEVPSLVHDPGDPAAPWKLFFHRIFRTVADDGSSAVEPAASWISLRTATDPGGTWSAEVDLFRGAVPPGGGSPQVNVSGLDPSLAHLLVYSEPGGFVRDGTIYLSLTGLVASGSDRIVLLASDDHAGTWRFVSSLLTSADAALLGHRDFDGTSIVEQDGRVFLLASPGSGGQVRNGTLVLEFDDLATGTLKRESGGAPIVLAHVIPDGGYDNPVGGGQADYHEGNTAGGLLLNQLSFAEAPMLFNIRQTGHAVIPTPEPRSGVLLLLGLGLTNSLVEGRSSKRRSRRR